MPLRFGRLEIRFNAHLAASLYRGGNPTGGREGLVVRGGAELGGEMWGGGIGGAEAESGTE